MLTLPSSVRVFLAVTPVDMRGSFDALAGQVRRMALDPQDGHLYVFMNGRKTLMKILFFDRSGWCIFAKRLEQGTFQIPAVSEGQHQLKIDPAVALPPVQVHLRVRRLGRLHALRVARPDQQDLPPSSPPEPRRAAVVAHPPHRDRLGPGGGRGWRALEGAQAAALHPNRRDRREGAHRGLVGAALLERRQTLTRPVVDAFRIWLKAIVSSGPTSQRESWGIRGIYATAGSRASGRD